MIWGLTTSAFTELQVALSLVGIGTGLVVRFGLLAGKLLRGRTGFFLATTILTSVTGFGFPFDHLLPSHKVGVVSLFVLTVAIAALYAARLAGAWRRIYAICSVLALYLNVFVLVVQLFLKVPALKAIAPTQKEPSFLITPLAGLIVLGVLAALSAVRFRAEPIRAA
jgi:hypothetical protein